MSDVLWARLRTRLAEMATESLTLDEQAWELLDAALPLTEQAEWDEPIWWAMAYTSGVCSNCLCTDCGCCVGCGGINADIVGKHGYWCGL